MISNTPNCNVESEEVMSKVIYKNNIKKYRKEAGLTQGQFSTQCKWGGNQSRVAHYEAGTREPSLGDVRTIIFVLRKNGIDVTIDEVFPTKKAVKR